MAEEHTHTKPDSDDNGTYTNLLIQGFHLSGFHPAPRQVELPDEVDLIAPIPALPEALALLRQTLGLVDPVDTDHSEAVQKALDE